MDKEKFKIRMDYLLNSKISTILVIIAWILYVLESIRLLNNRKTEQVKKPLVVTKRVRRLIVTISILFVLPIIIYFIYHENGYIMLLI